MFTIELYKNSAENNRVDKSSYLVLVDTLQGTARDGFSITDLDIEIQFNGVPNFNYLYIAELKRYYYVDDFYNVANNLWILSASIDVLMSYKDGVLNSVAFIDRNEYESSKNVVDDKRVVEQGYDVETVELKNALFTDYVGSYLITGLGFSIFREYVKEEN